MIKLIYTFLFINLVLPLAAQQHQAFHALILEDGLAQNTITAITQDTHGFLWFGTPNGLSRFDSKEFKNYKHNPQKNKSLLSDYVHALLCDSKGRLWIGTNNGLNRYNPDTDSFDSFLAGTNKNNLSHATVLAIFEDHNGHIWIGTRNGINRLIEEEGQIRIEKYLTDYPLPNKRKIETQGFVEDPHNNLWCATSEGLVKVNLNAPQSGIRFFRPDTTRKNFFNNTLCSIALDNKDQLWAGTLNGKLYTFSPQKEQFEEFPKSLISSEPFSIIYEILPYHNGKLWIGTNNGLFLLDPETRQIQAFFHDARNTKTINDNNILSIFVDKQRTLWIGTYYGGINYIYDGKSAFYPLLIGSGIRTIANKIIKDPQGQLWANSLQEGLLKLNKSQNNSSLFPLKLPKATTFQEIYFDSEGILWIGTFENKIIRYDMRTNVSHQYLLSDAPELDPQRHAIPLILEDTPTSLWIGNNSTGLYRFNKITKTAIRYSTNKNSPIRLANNQIYCMFKDKHANLWLGTNSGVQLIRKDNSTEWFPTLVNKHASSYKGAVNAIKEDTKGRIWIGTFYTGLKLYQPATNTLVLCKGLEAYPDINVTNILSDQDGYLWLSHEGGLLRYHPDKTTVQEYDFADGLPGQEIVPYSAFHDSDGEIFFSTNASIFRFYPKQVTINTQIPSVVFTELKLFNNPVAVNDSTHLLNKNISKVDKVVFRHDQSIFTIQFAVLNFIRPKKNQYAYMLAGFEKNWNYVKNPSATYTNLPAGTYTLLIKGANNDGLWNTTPTRLTIVVLPPWWKTDFAYVMYCLITGFAFFLIIRFFWIRENFRRETELYQTKLDFFTNISHEIRTHLTLISGPVDNLITLRKNDSEIQKMLSFTKRNTDLLLKLVSELLDFTKLQSGLVKLNISENDLIPFLKNIVSSVDYLFIEKNVTLQFSSTDPHIKLWFDPAQLQKVIYNLLINAYKFTPKGGQVSLAVSQTPSQIQIKIIDNGIGISPDYLKKIFSNFFQVSDNTSQNTGYGIGLALAKSIIELHKGELLVDSHLGNTENRTCFTMSLLKGKTHLETYLPAEPTAVETETAGIIPAETHELKTNKVLLVEDNQELRAFIKELLLKNYEVSEASNGMEAWEIVTTDIPDVVITDIMMTELSGLELCRKIKADVRTIIFRLLF